MTDETIHSGRVEVRGDAAILELFGEIDMTNAPIVERQFVELSGLGLNAVVIDATRVTFIDSTGLHALISGRKSMNEGGCDIYIVPSEPVRRLLDLVSPNELFAARFDSVETALAQLDGRHGS